MPYADPDAQREYRRRWKAERRAQWISSMGGRCASCGSTASLEVDHVDRTTKACSPTMIWTRSRAFREAELAKCQVLCSDCHLAKTLTESTPDDPHGTSFGYQTKKCRCRACRSWNAARVRARRHSSRASPG